ncbi:MAG: hypothetical protein IKP78_06070 [Ruminococcus sp.]|nr:hypothetical protein [Ruminococcus sp.]
MKHTRKTALTAAMLTAAVSMTAAVTLTSCYPQTAYGPPDTDGPAATVATDEPPLLQTEYGPPPAYVPETEEPQDVYGPPPTMDEDPTVVTTQIDILPEETTAETVTEVSTDTTTKPIDMQFVYGPPSAVED